MMEPTKTPRAESKHPGEASPGVCRRSLLNILWAALGLAALAEFLWLAFSFLRPAGSGDTGRRANSVTDAGPVASFTPGTVTAFQKGEFYLVRLDDGGVLAL